MIKSAQVEVGAKSRLRITIESLLIDLNEEIFSLSEELANSFGQDYCKVNLIAKAREFDQRKSNLLRKVEETIENDPTARIICREFRISSRTVKRRSASQHSLS